jgi:hypothetical protein
MARWNRWEHPSQSLFSFQLVHSNRWQGTHRATVSNAIRANHAEAQFEEVRDLVSPGHGQVREAMNLQPYQYTVLGDVAIACL